MNEALRGEIKDLEMWVRPYAQEFVLLGNKRNHPELYKEVVQDYFREGGYWPVVLGTHKAHPAGFLLMEEADDIGKIANQFSKPSERISGSLLVIAKTLEEENERGQNAEVVQGFKGTEKIFERFHTDTVPIIREEDKSKFSEDEVRKSNRNYWKVLSNVVKNGEIPLLFPEGTVARGRQKEGGYPGELRGMVPFRKNSIALLEAALRKQHKEPLYFFVVPNGENNIYDPVTEKITEQARKTAVARMLPLLRVAYPRIMSAVVDYPLPHSQLVDMFGVNGKLEEGVLEQACGEIVARLVPPNERGVYSTPKLVLDPEGLGRRDNTYLFQ